RQLAEEDREHGAGPGEEKVAGKARPFVNVLPAEEDEVLPEDGLDVIAGEGLANGAAMLVVYDATRLVKHLPAAFPGHVAEIRIFQVKGLQQPVEAAELEKLRAAEGTTAAAAVETGEEIVDR